MGTLEPAIPSVNNVQHAALFRTLLGSIASHRACLCSRTNPTGGQKESFPQHRTPSTALIPAYVVDYVMRLLSAYLNRIPKHTPPVVGEDRYLPPFLHFTRTKKHCVKVIGCTGLIAIYLGRQTTNAFWIRNPYLVSF